MYLPAEFKDQVVIQQERGHLSHVHTDPEVSFDKDQNTKAMVLSLWEVHRCRNPLGSALAED